MPKGVMTGNPTNLVCWLVGGYYNDTVWGIAYDKDNLNSEITMHHFENPRAKMMGVKILGITHQAPDDILIHDVYRLVHYQEEAPAFAIYIAAEEYYEWDKHHDEKVAEFIRAKGYDLPDQHLDPANMPGEIRKVDV